MDPNNAMEGAGGEQQQQLLDAAGAGAAAPAMVPQQVVLTADQFQQLIAAATRPASPAGRVPQLPRAARLPELVTLKPGDENVHDWYNVLEQYFALLGTPEVLMPGAVVEVHALERARAYVLSTLRGGDVEIFKAEPSVWAGVTALKQDRLGRPAVRRVQLLVHFWSLTIASGETPRQAASRLRDIATRLREVDYVMDDENLALALMAAAFRDKELQAQCRNVLGLGLELTLQNAVAALEPASQASQYLTVPGALVAQAGGKRKSQESQAEAHKAQATRYKSPGAARGGQSFGRGGRGRHSGSRGAYRGARGGYHAGRGRGDGAGRGVQCLNCNRMGHGWANCWTPCIHCGAVGAHPAPGCPVLHRGAAHVPPRAQATYVDSAAPVEEARVAQLEGF